MLPLDLHGFAARKEALISGGYAPPINAAQVA